MTVVIWSRTRPGWNDHQHSCSDQRVPDPDLTNNSASVDVEVETPPVTRFYVYMPLMFKLSGGGIP